MYYVILILVVVGTYYLELVVLLALLIFVVPADKWYETQTGWQRLSFWFYLVLWVCLVLVAIRILILMAMPMDMVILRLLVILILTLNLIFKFNNFTSPLSLGHIDTHSDISISLSHRHIYCIMIIIMWSSLSLPRYGTQTDSKSITLPLGLVDSQVTFTQIGRFRQVQNKFSAI